MGNVPVTLPTPCALVRDPTPHSACMRAQACPAHCTTNPRLPPMPAPSGSDGATLSESVVEEAFHALLQDALIQAQAEGLLSDEDIHWLDADLQIIAPSLALYFAALQAQGSPPVISSPSNTSFVLSQDNCPPSFASFFTLWQACVAKIQRLDLERRHDLALLLCEKEAASSPIRMDVAALARDLKVVAVDIVQRSTFQRRFQADVQTAIDSSLKTATGSSHYIAPPSEASPSSSALQPPSNAEKPVPPLPPARTGSNTAYRPLPPPPLPTIAVEPPPEETTTLMLIRETLFAALGDCLATNQDLLSLLQRGDKSWSSRCYFASLCLSVLDVCLLRVHLPTLPDMDRISTGIRRSSFPWGQAYVKTVHVADGPGKVTLENCPSNLSKLLYTLFRIAMFVQSLGEADDKRAMEDASNDIATRDDDLYIPQLKRKLLGDVAHPTQQQEPDARADYVTEAAVMINRAALGECLGRQGPINTCSPTCLVASHV